MIEIKIDSKIVNMEPLAGEKLSDLFERTLNEKVPADYVISDLMVNGEFLNLDDDDHLLVKNVNEFNSIEFFTRSSLELSFEALDNAGQYIDFISDSIRILIDLYRNGDSQQAEQIFLNTIERIDLFVQLISKVCSILKKNYKTNFNEQIITDLEIHLLSIVKGLLPAKEKNDQVMLNDLLEYELLDNLTQWKIQAIPELRKLQNL